MNHEHDSLRLHQFIVIRTKKAPLEVDVYAYGQTFEAADTLQEIFPDMVSCICLNPPRPSAIAL